MNIHNNYTHPIDNKITLLQDFSVLQKNATRQEAAICTILAVCHSEIRMEQKVHNLIYGLEKMKDFLAREEIQMHQSAFSIKELKNYYAGYTAGANYNGAGTPYFEINEALTLAKEFSILNPKTPIKYKKRIDAFVYQRSDGRIEIWKGRNYLTNQGIKHLYDIGTYSWMWEIKKERIAI